MMEWQPIETAPRDGKMVLIARRFDADPDFAGVDGGVVSVGYWVEGFSDGPDEMGSDSGWQDAAYPGEGFHAGRSFGNPDYMSEGYQPTHWMPLPDPPNPHTGG